MLSLKIEARRKSKMQNRKTLDCLGAGLVFVLYLFSFNFSAISAEGEGKNNTLDVVTGKTSAPEAPGKYYIVQRGDTLWSISNAHYTDPFLWPKLWGKNEHIPHPDKIYPGQKIFLPSEQFLKEVEEKETEVSETVTAAHEKEPSMETPPVQQEESLPAIEPETGVPVEKETAQEEREPVRSEGPVEETAKAPPSLPLSLSEFFASGYIVKDGDTDLKKEAEIIGSEFDHNLLADGDLVYILAQDKTGKKFRPGQQLTIYSMGRVIRHPSTHKLFGNVVRILGVAEVESEPMPGAGRLTHSARIIKTYDQIKVGDLAALYQPPDPESLVVDQSSFPNKMRGLIIAAKEPKEFLGQKDIIYIDKGSRQGMRPGHHLVVFREGSHIPTKFRKAGSNNHFPERIVADLEVITVRQNTATAIILDNTEAINLGDPFAEPSPLQ